MNKQISYILSQAIHDKLAKGPSFKFDGSVEDVFDRVVYFDDFIPIALEEFTGLYEKIMDDYSGISPEEIDMELLSLTKEALRLP